MTSSAAVAAQTSIFGAAIANGGTFWIRWTDSDLMPGSEDGLAIDDLTLVASVSGGGGGSTNPSATGTATSTAAVNTATFSGNITAGTNPASASYTVTCDLTAVGGSSTFALNVSGTSIAGTYAAPGATPGFTIKPFFGGDLGLGDPQIAAITFPGITASSVTLVTFSFLASAVGPSVFQVTSDVNDPNQGLFLLEGPAVDLDRQVTINVQSAVPEPGTLSLAGLAGGLFLVAVRRRRGAAPYRRQA